MTLQVAGETNIQYIAGRLRFQGINGEVNHHLFIFQLNP